MERHEKVIREAHLIVVHHKKDEIIEIADIAISMIGKQGMPLKLQLPSIGWFTQKPNYQQFYFQSKSYFRDKKLAKKKKKKPFNPFLFFTCLALNFMNDGPLLTLIRPQLKPLNYKNE